VCEAEALVTGAGDRSRHLLSNIKRDGSWVQHKNLHNKRRKMKEGHSGLAHVEAKIRIKDY
jgi:hypothetical protein